MNHTGIRKKLALWALCLCLALCTALAVAEPAEPVTAAPVETAEAITPVISDTQAAAGFITQVMTGKKLTPPKPRGTVSGDQLTGREAVVYAALKEKIQQAAAGELDSTEFRIPLADIYEDVHYTAADLGVDYIYDFDTGTWNDAAFDAFNALTAFDFQLANRALLYDLPYDLYWYDKTAGTSWFGAGSTSDGNTVFFEDFENGYLTFSYIVSSDYSVDGASGTYALDTSYGARAVTSAANARQVVESNKYKSDLHKLQAYKDYICGEVTYDHAAANKNNHTPYGDPWQLVSVFDGDSSTNVVCEGYSKAFQFLCDESSFLNTSVISVTGTMAGGTGAGAHMWNIVTMSDGLHYMADITNSDSGSIGQDGGLFLSGYTPPIIPENHQYNYLVDGETIAYMYDDETLQLLESTGMLAMSGTAYQEEPVTEIIPVSIPSGIVLGENLTVYAFFPGTEGSGSIGIVDGNGNWRTGSGFSYSGTDAIECIISAEDIVNTGLVPGNYTLRFECRYNNLNISGSKEYPLILSGEVFERPTLDAPCEVEAGGTMHLSGQAGSADALQLWRYFTSCDGTYSQAEQSVEIQADGSWSCDSVTEPAPGVYYLSIRGWKSGLSSGSRQGTVLAYDDSAYPAPTIRYAEEDDHYVITGQLPVVPGEGDNITWFVFLHHENEDRSESYLDPSGEDGSYTGEFFPSAYEDNTTVTLAYRINGQTTSRTASVVIHNEGKPWPANETLPLEFDIPETWPAGVDFTLDWTPAVEGQYLSGGLFRLDGDEEIYAGGDDLTGAGQLQIRGYRLSEGLYIFRFHTEAEGYEPVDRTYSLEVVVNPDQPATPAVTLDPAEPTDMNHITFIADREFDELDVDLYQPEDEEYNTPDHPWFSFGTEGDRVPCNRMVPVGDWNARIRAKVGDVWCVPAILEFTVEEAPSVGPIVLDGTIPAIDMYRPFSIRLQPAEHALVYYASLMYNTAQAEDGSFYSEEAVYARLELDEPAAEPVTLTFEDWKDELPAGTTYWLYITADAEGYKTSSQSFNNLTVNEMERPAAPTDIQILSSNGTPLTEEERLNLRQGVLPVRITYPQAMQKVQLTLWLEGPSGSADLYWNEDPITLNSPATVWTSGSGIDISDEGSFYILARVMVDDAWSSWSNAVSFEVIPPPQLAAPTVTADKDSLTLGESLTLTITDIDPAAEYIIIRNQGGEYYEITVWNLTEPVTVILPEERFAPGENGIRVIAGADQAVGGNTALTVHVTGQRPAAPTVSFSATSAPVGETVYATVDAPGASQVKIESDWTGSDYYALQNGSVRIPIQISYYSNVSISCRFRAQTNGVWSEWTEPFQVSSLSERPAPGEQQFVVMPDEIMPGQDMEITFLPVDGMSEYYISVEHGNGFYFYNTYTEPGTVTLPAILFADGGWYGFDVGAGDSYAPDILVENRAYEVDPVSDPIGQTLSISAAKTSLEFCEETEVCLNVPAEKVIWQKFEPLYGDIPVWADTNEVYPEEGEETLSAFPVAFGFGQGGEFPVRASALVNGEWTGWSNILTFTEAPQHPTPLTHPVADVPPEIPEGSPLPVSWAAAEHAESYKVEWHSTDYSVRGSRTTSGLSLVIPAEELPAGDYFVTVQNMASGYENDGHYVLVPFRVVAGAPVAPISLNVPPTWPAGVDLTVDWPPLEDVENQRATLYIERPAAGDDDWDRWYAGGYTRLGEDTSVTINGYRLEAGEYVLTAVLKADGYETGQATYPLTVTANPDQPAAPVPTLTVDHLYANIPGRIHLDREYDEIYCKYLSTEGGFGDDRISSGDEFSILTEEALTYRVSVSGRIGNVWSPVGRLMVTAEPTPEITEIRVVRAPEAIQPGDGMALETLWPDGWDTAFVGIKRVGFGSLYANTFHRNPAWPSYTPYPYTYVNLLPESLNRYGLLPGDTVSVEFFCLDRNGHEMDSLTLQIPVLGEASRILTLPSALTEIEAEALAGTNAQRIVIPASCTAVGSKAFAGSSELVEVIVRGTATVIPADAFDGCDQTVVLWLPEGNPSEAAFQDNPKVTVAILGN